MSALTLAEAKTHLNITVSTYDTELQTFVDAAEAVITNRCGPLASTATTRRLPGGVYALVLPVIPVVSLTSVTPVGGSALTLADLYPDLAAGVVTFNAGGRFGARAYDVVYQAGRTTVPKDLLSGVKELVRHLWSTSQRGSGTRRPGSEQGVNPATFLLPYAVQSLIEPYCSPGFA